MFLALLLATVLPTYGPLAEPSATPYSVPGLRLPVAAGEALIVNSGSTNQLGYRLRVYDTGWTAVQQGDAAIRKRVPAALVKRFFADLRAAGRVDRLPRATCMKSMSFGSTTQVAYRGSMSPDLSCPSTSAAARLLSIDATALASAAGVTMQQRTRAL
jgi:hypothetical protein